MKELEENYLQEMKEMKLKLEKKMEELRKRQKEK